MAQKIFIFDFDSTLFPGETLDEIIQLQLESETESESKKKEITNICNLGMSGAISMEQSLKRRLEIGAPTEETIKKYVVHNQRRIEIAIVQLLHKLQKAGHKVLVVSGGFEEWIRPLLKDIVPKENIHANQIREATQPMHFENIIRRDKEMIIAELVTEHLKKEIIMIGDGATDFSVFQNGLARHFIGAFYYTGIKKREAIVQLAHEHKQKTFERLNDFIEYIQTI